MMTGYLHLVVGCWVALGIKPEPTRRPVDGHLSRGPLQWDHWDVPDDHGSWHGSEASKSPLGCDVHRPLHDGSFAGSRWSAAATAGPGVSRVNGAPHQVGAPAAGYLLLATAPLTTPSHWCAAGIVADSPVVGIAGLADGEGGWEVSADGSVFACAAAGYYGSVPGLGIHLAQPVVGVAPTPDGRGYWLVAADGGVFAFGDARYVGGANSEHLNSPIVGMVSAGVDDGYWLVAADGGVFAYGRAAFEGSMGGLRLNAPIVGIASAGGQGYWLVAADGGVFAFGAAPFYGSAASVGLSAPASGISAAPDGHGYWIVAQDGGVFAYGSASFDPEVGPIFGTPVGVTPVNPVIALLPDPSVGSYSLAAAFPAIEPSVSGRSGYDLARLEFALTPDRSEPYAVEADLAQASEYLLLDGTANGKSANAVATCLYAFDQLESYIGALFYGRAGSVTYETAEASAAQITAFFGLPSDPYLQLLEP